MTFGVQNRIIQGKSLQKHWVFSKKSLFRYRENTKVRLRTPSQPIFWHFPSIFETFEPIFGALFFISHTHSHYKRGNIPYTNPQKPNKNIDKTDFLGRKPTRKIYCLWTTLKIGFSIFFLQQTLFCILYIVLYYIWYYL